MALHKRLNVLQIVSNRPSNFGIRNASALMAVIPKFAKAQPGDFSDLALRKPPPACLCRGWRILLKDMSYLRAACRSFKSRGARLQALPGNTSFHFTSRLFVAILRTVQIASLLGEYLAAVFVKKA
jgi:hypothetical protein